MLHQFLQNMRRLNKFLMIAAAVVMAASCSTKAVIDGTVASLPSGEVIVKLLDINKYQVLDTVSTDAAGRFSLRRDAVKSFSTCASLSDSSEPATV